MIKATFQKDRVSGPDVARVAITESEDSFVEREAGGGRVISLGVGKREKFNRRKLILAVRKIITLAKQNKIEKIALDLNALKRFEVSDRELAELTATNFELANYEFNVYKTPPEDGWKFVEQVFVCGRTLPEVKQGWKEGQVIGEETNNCRTLSNTPGGDMTPTVLAKAARRAVAGLKVKVTVLDSRAMARLGMGGILGVAKGSSEPPRFIVMKYQGGGKAGRPVVLIGKGVTFDTGGLSLKPADAMADMHMDMSGGAAVIHAIAALARLGVKKKIVGLVPAVENAPSGASFRPGDILKSMSGKTIEVLNTDAEGRIILADALHYAKQHKPAFVVDVATLTGAAMVALGQRASALFTEDDEMARKITEAGEASGDYVWRMPLWDEYDEEVKGTFGDVLNIGKTKYGGAITAAAFLKQFAGDMPWAHIDIAPRMTSVENEHLAKGAAGAPVRLLTELLRAA